jgi:ribosome biogenesis protein ERB1
MARSNLTERNKRKRGTEETVSGASTKFDETAALNTDLGLTVPSDPEDEEDLPAIDGDSEDSETEADLENDDSEVEEDDEDTPDEEEDESDDSGSDQDDEDDFVHGTERIVPFPVATTIVSDITGQPKRVYPEIEPDYDSDSSTEEVRVFMIRT